MNALKNGWYVLYTKPHHERKVIKYLDELGIPQYLPTKRILKVWPSKKKYVQLPLFPSYVFVKLESIKKYLESLTVPGVLNYVRIGTQIASISENIIFELQTILSYTTEEVSISTEYFNPGTILRICAGPFAGFSCEVIQIKGKHKILVRIELLRRNILLDLPSEYVSALIPSQNKR